MGWKFEEPNLPANQGATEGDKWLRYIIRDANARSIWISFAVDLKHWVDRARKIEAEAPTEGNAAAATRKEKLLIVIMVHSADKAKEVMTWPGVDAIVLQGLSSPSLQARKTKSSLSLELTQFFPFQVPRLADTAPTLTAAHHSPRCSTRFWQSKLIRRRRL